MYFEENSRKQRKSKILKRLNVRFCVENHGKLVSDIWISSPTLLWVECGARECIPNNWPQFLGCQPNL